ncbi:MAG: serine/threonine protein kinase, partial [Thermaceae bacterium]|nr:serine/threonine protein kinase [Thermaceae bacterium]
YLGEQVYLKSLAAIKVLSAPMAPEAADGFLREAQTLASLVHPHIVRLLDYGVEGQTPYLVMDYAPGGTLRKRTAQGQQLSLPTVVAYVKQVAEALQYAHDQRLIHRDVKPANLLLGRHDEVLLSDFGISLLVSSSRSDHTQDMAGTITYMAPEQLQGHPCQASDQYALGVIAYEWLAGKRPFSGSFEEIAAQHCLAKPPSLGVAHPGLPQPIEAVILHALAKRPEQRFANVQAFAEMLERAVATTGDRPAQRVLASTRPASGRQWCLEDDFEGRSTS